MGSMRDDILAVDDLPREPVATPEWEPNVPKVWVRGLTSSEKDSYEQRLISAERGRNAKVDNLRAEMVVRIAVDESGKRIFEDKDVTALGEKSSAVVSRLWDKGRELSGMLTEKEKAELAKKYGQDPTAPSDTSSTD